MASSQIKQIFKIILIISSIVSLYFVPWILVKAWILPLPNTVQTQLNEAVNHGLDGMIVYIDQAGEQPKTFTSGWHNKEKQIPAKPDALFKIASINKLYTAVCLAKLVHQNKLDLEKTLADYKPELIGKIENTDKITLKMMVQHRSGIPNYTNTTNYWAHPPETGQGNLELIFHKPASFAPDSNYEYSNTNYLLLSQIIEEALGYSKFRFITEEILTPLGLKNTFESVKNVDINDVMSGYHVGHLYDLKTDDYGIVATAENVGIFLKAMNNGTLFGSKEEQNIYTSIYEYKHSGWVPGYQSFAEYHKDIDAVIIQFNNTTDADLLLWNLAQIVNNRIVDILEKE